VKLKEKRIQKTFPPANQIGREIRYSVYSVVIFSIVGTIMYETIINGYTKMYFHISNYGLIYFVVSPFITFLIHDTYFYWTHRFMHFKKVFKYVHRTHHMSTNPAPFAIFAFQPAEAIIHSALYPLMFILMPIHPIVLGIFLLYNLITNLFGHSGFEFIPVNFSNHWFFRWQNSVTSHDLHHTNVNCNYGNYFTFWDKWMGTYKI
jgi:sterol desaturase/sphingolipid hydroxylase (fatty acid hydroxylase superfamily)